MFITALAVCDRIAGSGEQEQFHTTALMPGPLFATIKTSSEDIVEYRRARNQDFKKLVDIRIRAMKPSLEKVGRFDKNRATERLRKSFIPQQTTIIMKEEEIIGFYMTILDDQKLFLNHLYIDPKFQGNGFGTTLLNQVKCIARKYKKAIELEVLKESRSNTFYFSNGFIKVGESKFDNLYRWEE